MQHQASQNIVSIIWGIADDVLRDVYVRGKYRDVILPMTVIRRLDADLSSERLQRFASTCAELKEAHLVRLAA